MSAKRKQPHDVNDVQPTRAELQHLTKLAAQRPPRTQCTSKDDAKDIACVECIKAMKELRRNPSEEAVDRSRCGKVQCDFADMRGVDPEACTRCQFSGLPCSGTRPFLLNVLDGIIQYRYEEHHYAKDFDVSAGLCPATTRQRLTILVCLPVNILREGTR
jgi:hypothetical protein